jgi:hypothetical protein
VQAQTDHDAARGRIDVKAVVAIPPMLAVANNDLRIRTMDAARHAGAVIANFAAYPFGIGGVGECKPQGGSCDADKEFGHRQPPLRPPAVSLGCAPGLSSSMAMVWFPTIPASAPRGPTTVEQRSYGFM